jgi:Tol biopolymer transport system component
LEIEQPEVLIRRPSNQGGTISPDGQFIACNYQDKEGEEFRVAILPFAGGPPIKLLDLPPSENLSRSEKAVRWTPDGRAIAYIITENEVSNIWAQPIDVDHQNS